MNNDVHTEYGLACHVNAGTAGYRIRTHEYEMKNDRCHRSSSEQLLMFILLISFQLVVLGSEQALDGMKGRIPV